MSTNTQNRSYAIAVVLILVVLALVWFFGSMNIKDPVEVPVNKPEPVVEPPVVEEDPEYTRRLRDAEEWCQENPIKCDKL